MTADEIKAQYRDMCRMPVKVRRYAVVASVRTSADFAVQGHIRLFSGKELTGTIAQGDVAVIVLADDLAAKGFQLPITAFDKIVEGGKERSILPPIGERKALDGTLVAYELQARG